MKLRIFFLKKKYIYYILCGVVILTILITLFPLKKSSATFNVTNDALIKKADFNGDGTDDILYIKTDKNKYYLQITINNDSIFLEPCKKLNSLGMYNPYWPMKVTLMDISRDNIPEIFIQSSYNNSPIQHAFLLKDKKFEDIFCSSNNIIGFLDLSNNKTPKFFSGNFYDGSINLSNYILNNNSLENFTYSVNTDLMGKKTIQTFIKYMLSLPNDVNYKPIQIFDNNITSKSLYTLSSLNKENRQYIFQDATFMDTECNKNGDLTKIKWILSFKGISTSNNMDIKNFKLNLILRSNTVDNTVDYKICSINLE